MNKEKRLKKVPKQMMFIGFILAAALIFKALHIEHAQTDYYSIKTAKTMIVAAIIIFFECSIAAVIFEHFRTKQNFNK